MATCTGQFFYHQLKHRVTWGGETPSEEWPGQPSLWPCLKGIVLIGG